MSSPAWLEGATRASAWGSLHVVVAGVGVSGFAVADGLLRLGARVTVLDGVDDSRTRERGQILEILGASIGLGAGAVAGQALPTDADLVVTSPGWSPAAPLLVAASAAGVAVWGEVELAWRLRPLLDPAPWLCLSGTNGKTTCVRMLEEMLRASGARVTAAGNVGLPLIDAVLADEPYDVLAVELSSFQLHWTQSMRPLASAVLNVAEDHIDWHGSMVAYAEAKGRVYANTTVACIYNVDDPITEDLVRAADVQEGCRAVGFTLGPPSVGMLGLVEDVLVDRAFVEDRANTAAELGTIGDVRPAAPHNVANALAAAALARAYGVPPRAVLAGLRAFVPDPHRIALAGVFDGVTFIDDSKATNPHAAAASLLAYESVVWLAGGLAKGAAFDDLVPKVSRRLRGVVTFGTDGPAIAAAVRRHAPEIPVVEVANVETGLVGADVMVEVVRAAAVLARRGDTVLLAPACASMDQFRDYGQRGDDFVAVVRTLANS